MRYYRRMHQPLCSAIWQVVFSLKYLNRTPYLFDAP